MTKLLNFILLIRPHHAIKNLFVLAPIFFAERFFEKEAVIQTLWAVLAFYLTSAIIYIINDIKDLEKDRQHPKKSKRPLASGKINKTEALLGVLVILFIHLGLYFWVFQSFALYLVLLAYFILNLAYTFYLKKVALIDITIVALGFIFRLYAGAIVSDTPLSQWIVALTFLLSLFLAFAKRRDDLLILEKSGVSMRKSLEGYNLRFVDTCLSVMTAVIIVTYVIYTVSPEVTARVGSEQLFTTALWVVLGLLRYLQLTFVLEKSGNPTALLLKDPVLQLSVFAYCLHYAFIFYWNA